MKRKYTRLDLTNKRYTKLTAIRVHHSNGLQVFWECRCDCGATRLIATGELTSGRRKSCGCLKNKDLTGRRFGKLIVETLVGRKRGQRIWQCECDCGKKTTLSTAVLLSHHTTSCGCRQAEVVRERCWKGCGDVSGDYWCGILAGAKSRKLKVEVTIEDAWHLFEKQNGKCALSGTPLSFASKRGKAILVLATFQAIFSGFTKTSIK